MIESKICTNCREEKEISNFSKKNKLKDGTQKYQSICKKCVNEQMKYIRVTDEFKQKRIEYDKEYYRINREKVLQRKKEYHIENRDDILEKKREYREKPENKERANAYIKKYIKENRDKYYKYRRLNPHIIAWRRLLYRTLYYLKKEKDGNTFNELQYTPQHLKEHLESLFKEGMSWNNYGEWEIDHIKPLTKWDESSLPREVNALSNLQPLWKLENIQKYNH